MKQQVLVFCALLSLIFSPVVALGRPLVASAAAADPMFQVQVPGVFKQKAFPVDATAGKSVPGVVTLADAESAFAGRGGLAASASGSLGSIFTPGAMAINLFTGGSSRAEFRLPDVTFSGPAFSEPKLIGFAYAFEQATHHRVPPASTPPLPGDSVSRP